METNEVIYYSARDIVEIYPNNLGLQKALSQFIMQMKIRPVKHGVVRVNQNSPQIRIAYYSARKVKKAIESYMVTAYYKISTERKENLNILLGLISDKIEKEKRNIKC